MLTSYKKPIIVATGLHRSGTTYLGRKLAQVLNSYYLWEPLSPNCMIGSEMFYLKKRVFSWYLAPNPENIELTHELLFNIERKKSLYVNRTKYIFNPQVPIKQKTAFLQALFAYLRAISFGYNSVIIKDPFLLFMIPFINKSGLLSIATIKNPYSWVASLKRQGWSFDWSSFITNHSRFYMPDSIKIPLKNASEIANFDSSLDSTVNASLLWYYMYHYIQANHESFSYVLDSDSLNAHTVENICNSLSLPATQSPSFTPSLIFGSTSKYEPNIRSNAWKSILTPNEKKAVELITGFTNVTYQQIWQN